MGVCVKLAPEHCASGEMVFCRTLVNACLQYLGIAYPFAYGVWLFDDRFTWMALAGMLLIVGAGLAATLLRSQTLPADVVKASTAS
jgi:S-adenosylmethionine uptake transporter